MQHEEPRPPSTESWDQPPVEYFSDVIWTSVNPWSCSITFGLRATRPEEKDKPTIRVRMPLQQGKALGVLLLSTIRHYEQQTKTDVGLPDEVLKSLRIAPEDWKRFKTD